MPKEKTLIKNKTARIFLLSYVLVMLLPLSIGLAYYYPTTRAMLVERAAERSARAVDQLRGQMDAQLANVMNMPSYITSNQQIIEYEILYDPLGARLAKDQLSQMIRTNTFIEHLFLYIRENQFMISARTGSLYFRDITEDQTLYQMSFGDVLADDLQAMLDTASKPIVVPSNSVVISGGRYGRMLLFVMPVPQSKRAYGSALICVPASNLASMIPLDDSEDAGNMLFYSDMGELLYNSRALPKSAREAVESFLVSAGARGKSVLSIDGETNLVTWAASAKYGWRYVNVLPISAVTGEINRLQRMTILITGGIAILSALFIYIAMKINYAPIRKLARIASEAEAAAPAHSLNDFKTIQALIDNLKTKNVTLGERISETEPQLRRFLISQILHGDSKNLINVLRQAEQIGIDLTLDPYRAAIIEYSTEQEAEDALARLLERESDGIGELVAVNGDEPRYLNLILTGARSGWAALFRELAPGRLALGDETNQPSRISESFRQASAVMDYMRLNGIVDRVMLYEDLPDRVFAPRSYPLDVMQSLEMAIQHGDGERMLRLIDQLAALLSLEGMPPYFTRSVYFNAVNLLISGFNRVLGSENDAVMEIGMRSMLSHYTINEMVGILRNAAQQLARMMGQVARKEASISDIVHSIEKQISSPQLSLQSMADEAGISASAFSRMFKEKTGRNFKEYVDGMRVAHSKRMLINTAKPVEQIALEVGYETPTSFYRLFKKHAGIAPGEYRAAHGAEKKREIKM